MMMNDPMMMIMNVMRNGKDPRALIQQLASNDPRVRMAMQMVNGKSDKELEQIVRNMARERNIDIEHLARSMGIQIPSNK